MQQQQRLTFGLVVLGAGVAVTAVLGPLATGLLDYRTSELARNQIVGGDAAALLVVAPLCAVLAVLAHRRHPAAPVLALAPAGYALYMYSQLIMGNEYGQQAGNVERFFPLLLGIVLVAAWVAVTGWRAVSSAELPTTTRRYDRTVGGILLVLAAYLLLGIHLMSYLDAVSDHPSDPQYLGAPTAFWAVKLWDLAAVVPAAVVVGAGMLRGRTWARKPMYAILGGYLVLGFSVAGMAWTMYAKGDPGASLAQALTMSVLVGVMSVAAVRLYRPLFRAEKRPADTPVRELTSPLPVVSPALPSPGTPTLMLLRIGKPAPKARTEVVVTAPGARLSAGAAGPAPQHAVSDGRGGTAWV